MLSDLAQIDSLDLETILKAPRERVRAGDCKTYSIAKNTCKEINFFAKGSANAYSGFYGCQITCTGGELQIDGVEVDNMVKLLYGDEKFISREDDDGIIAQYNNVWLTYSAKNAHCIGGDVSNIWRVLLKVHCLLYHVQKFKGQMIRYDLSGFTIKMHKVVMSTDSSHVRFFVKGTKTECGQEFLTTNYPDLLIRDMVINSVPGRDLISRELPKNELKLSNFITNRDDFIYHEISCNLRREFTSVLHDECKGNLHKTKSEHFLDRRIPNFHTYRLGGSNYLTASGEVAYFYKRRPRHVAAIQDQTCYDAQVVKNNYTLTAYKQEDGGQVMAPRYHIVPFTHRITSVAKKVPCLSQFFCLVQGHFWLMVRSKATNLDHGATRHS